MLVAVVGFFSFPLFWIHSLPSLITQQDSTNATLSEDDSTERKASDALYKGIPYAVNFTHQSESKKLFFLRGTTNVNWHDLKGQPSSQT